MRRFSDRRRTFTLVANRLAILLPIALGLIDKGVAPSSTTVAAADDKTSDETPPKVSGKLFVRGFVSENDELKGTAIAVIDPATGSWKRLVENPSWFSVSPDRQTIVYSKDGALWNGDAETNANPGKVYSADGSAVFAPDSRSMIVTTSKPKPQKPGEYDTNVLKMGLDGLGVVSISDLDGMEVRDWSSDGQLLLVQKQRAVFVVEPDGRNLRQLLPRADHPRFSPDGKSVLYVDSWKGAIRMIDTVGARDRLFFQCPGLTMALMARYSPDGKFVAVVLLDLTTGNDGTPSLDADPRVSHPRIAILDTATAEQRILELPTQDRLSFRPVSRLEWR